MAGLGWSNPFPMVFGGGETPIELAYSALKSAAGKGAVAQSEDAIEAIWRQSKARVLGAVGGFDERAANQAFPDVASDLLPYYERTLLDRQRNPGETDDARRERAAAGWTDELGGSESEITLGLVAIDSRFSVLAVSESDTTTTVFGRWLEDLAATEPFGGGRKATLFPNYSTEFVFTAILSLGGGAIDEPTKRIVAEAQGFLADNLPAWMGIQVVTDADGFELDADVLDYTLLTGS